MNGIGQEVENQMIFASSVQLRTVEATQSLHDKLNRLDQTKIFKFCPTVTLVLILAYVIVYCHHS